MQTGIENRAIVDIDDGVAVGGGAVWVSDEAGDRVFRVDPQTDRVAQVINVGTGPTSLTVVNALPGRAVRDIRRSGPYRGAHIPSIAGPGGPVEHIAWSV